MGNCNSVRVPFLQNYYISLFDRMKLVRIVYTGIQLYILRSHSTVYILHIPWCPRFNCVVSNEIILMTLYLSTSCSTIV